MSEKVTSIEQQVDKNGVQVTCPRRLDGSPIADCDKTIYAGGVRIVLNPYQYENLCKALSNDAAEDLSRAKKAMENAEALWSLVFASLKNLEGMIYDRDKDDGYLMKKDWVKKDLPPEFHELLIAIHNMDRAVEDFRFDGEKMNMEKLGYKMTRR